jgi:formate C-acetyltransferase
VNDRIRQLREQSLSTVPFVSIERAFLLTEFYESGVPDTISIPVARALVFKYILKNKEICINNGELIVGERGPSPRATPTYPEICTHTLRDFEILDSREKIPFKISDSDDVRNVHRDQIIPFWSGRSIRDRIFRSVDPEWIAAYEAGIFTEFLEQRAPGHTVLDDKIYRNGFVDFKKRIEDKIAELDFFEDPEAYNRREELKAMAIAADAIMAFSVRHAEALEVLAEDEEDDNRKAELNAMAEICRHVPARAPRNFHEALQHYWFVHLGVIIELNTWDSFNPGRLDRHLWPFYREEIEAGTLTRERAGELLQAFWLKFNNQPAPPKVGVTAQESATYTDFCLINLGGVTEAGEDATN